MATFTLATILLAATVIITVYALKTKVYLQ